MRKVSACQEKNPSAATKRIAGLFIFLFIIFRAGHHHLPPPRLDTRETFPEDSPWDRCPFPARSCAPRGWGDGNGSSATRRRQDEDCPREGGRQTPADRNLRSYDVDDANWRGWLTIILTSLDVTLDSPTAELKDTTAQKTMKPLIRMCGALRSRRVVLAGFPNRDPFRIDHFHPANTLRVRTFKRRDAR